MDKFWRNQVFIKDFFKPLKDVQIAEEEARESEASDRVQAQIPCNNGLYVCMYVCMYTCMHVCPSVFL